MFALAGILGTLLFIYVRPHEFSPELREYNPLYFWLVMAVLGIAKDVWARRVRLVATPLLPYVIAFWVWCVITLAANKASLLPQGVTGISVCVALYLVLASPAQRVASYFKITVFVFALALFVASIGAHQGTCDFQCVVAEAGESMGRFADGRACENVDAEGQPRPGWVDCVETGQAGIVYVCERVGLFETTSVSGRVRYLGVLEDPNDLALATAMSLPFVFAFYQVRRRLVRLLLLGVAVTVIPLEIVLTQSRGGQLTFAAVLGVYFVDRYGWKRGAFVGGAMIAPMMLLGGRSDENAEASTYERLGCACAGIKMLLARPLFGVGHGQYMDHHAQTAHNSYILTAGELGFVGMWLFTCLIYLAIKVPVATLRVETGEDEEAPMVRAVALAILASFAGAAVGIFFLSWAYHNVLWIHLGLSGGLFAVVRRRHPAFTCRLSLREALQIALFCVALLAGWAEYIKYKGAWE